LENPGKKYRSDEPIPVLGVLMKLLPVCGAASVVSALGFRAQFSLPGGTPLILWILTWLTLAAMRYFQDQGHSAGHYLCLICFAAWGGILLGASQVVIHGALSWVISGLILAWACWGLGNQKRFLLVREEIWALCCGVYILGWLVLLGFPAGRGMMAGWAALGIGLISLLVRRVLVGALQEASGFLHPAAGEVYVLLFQVYWLVSILGEYLIGKNLPG